MLNDWLSQNARVIYKRQWREIFSYVFDDSDTAMPARKRHYDDDDDDVLPLAALARKKKGKHPVAGNILALGAPASIDKVCLCVCIHAILLWYN